MKITGKAPVSLLLLWCVASAVLLFASDKGDLSTAPALNKGQKWRLGYYEAGEYSDYPVTLSAMIRGLMDLGWVAKADLPAPADKQTKDFWNWLATEARSDYVEFVKDAHYSANWDSNLRKEISTTIIDRLNQKKDIDLMIAMGTKAGQDIANDKHPVPTVVFSASDPVSSGIIKSLEDSGCDNVHARVDPVRYERQVRIFHDIIPFRKLGMTYRNDVAGKSYAAVDKVEKVAEERKFEIITCYVPLDVPLNEEEESLKKCFDELGKSADAIYVTEQTGINKKSIPDLVKIAGAHRIPTFSQHGSEDVRYGFLLSISQAGFKYVGEFHAQTIAKILNGAKPRQLDQVFEDPPKIAINLKTAEIIGYDPPVDVLGSADEIYQTIENPKR
jgi:ABC-type uncharacterized transport system substrate-binding protein